MAGRYLVVASLLASTYAFSNTYPLIAWVSDSLTLPESVSSPSLEPVLNSFGHLENVCENDVIVVVEQPGLHASDLRTLSPSAPLSLALKGAASTLQLPYLRRSSDASLSEFVERISQRCNLPVISLSGSDVDRLHQVVRGRSRYIIYVEFPEISSESAWRRSLDINQRSANLYNHLQFLPASSKHLVLLAGAPRQEDCSDGHCLSPEVDIPSPAFMAPSNTTVPGGGILKRYQLLTPALIMTLIVALFVIVPVVYLGISALASIQAPARMEPPKRFNAQEKKTQ